MNLATEPFLRPGDLIAKVLRATRADDRMMIRTLIVVGALVIDL
jgi:hypothetical protein